MVGGKNAENPWRNMNERELQLCEEIPLRKGVADGSKGGEK